MRLYKCVHHKRGGYYSLAEKNILVKEQKIAPSLCTVDQGEKWYVYIFYCVLGDKVRFCALLNRSANNVFTRNNHRRDTRYVRYIEKLIDVPIIGIDFLQQDALDLFRVNLQQCVEKQRRGMQIEFHFLQKCIERLRSIDKKKYQTTRSITTHIIRVQKRLVSRQAADGLLMILLDRIDNLQFDL